jgi:hypothetical protein
LFVSNSLTRFWNMKTQSTTASFDWDPRIFIWDNLRQGKSYSERLEKRNEIDDIRRMSGGKSDWGNISWNAENRLRTNIELSSFKTESVENSFVRRQEMKFDDIMVSKVLNTWFLHQRKSKYQELRLITNGFPSRRWGLLARFPFPFLSRIREMVIFGRVESNA